MTPLLAVWTRVIFQPVDFYARMPAGGGWTRPLCYGAIWGTVASWLVAARIYLVPGFGTPPSTPAVPWGLPPSSVLMLAPVLALAWLLAYAGLAHTAVWLSGGRAGFRATLCVVAYATSVQVAGVVPHIGIGVMWMYGMALHAIGFSKVQRLSASRAALAALLPAVAQVVMVTLLLVLMVGLLPEWP